MHGSCCCVQLEPPNPHAPTTPLITYTVNTTSSLRCHCASAAVLVLILARHEVRSKGVGKAVVCGGPRICFALSCLDPG